VRTIEDQKEERSDADKELRSFFQHLRHCATVGIQETKRKTHTQTEMLANRLLAARSCSRMVPTTTLRCRRWSPSLAAHPNKQDTTALAGPSRLRLLWHKIRQRPVEYASIPCVAAFVGITTNWMGVKMLFYPIEYFGIDYRRWQDTPYGLFGWQGVVPTKTEQMAGRLVQIVTERLLRLDEAFGRLDPTVLTRLLLPAVQEQIRQDCGAHWAVVLQPVLPLLLRHVLTQLQTEIETCLDLPQIVLSAFVRDKVVLVDVSSYGCLWWTTQNVNLPDVAVYSHPFLLLCRMLSSFRKWGG